MINVPVSDIMNDHPLKVRTDTTIRQVAHLLMRYRINGVLVMNAQDPEKLEGVFTTRDFMDLMDEVMEQGVQKMQVLSILGEKPVGEFIDEKPLCLDVKDNAAKAIALMHRKNAITVPVFDGGKLAGVLGRHDIINIAFA